jgi:hypothetical protein
VYYCVHVRLFAASFSAILFEGGWGRYGLGVRVENVIDRRMQGAGFRVQGSGFRV